MMGGGVGAELCCRTKANGRILTIIKSAHTSLCPITAECVCWLILNLRPISVKFAFPDFSCLRIQSKISRGSLLSRFFFEVDISLVLSLALSESESLDDENSGETVSDDQSVTISLISQTSTTNQWQWRLCPLLGPALCHRPRTDWRNNTYCLIWLGHQVTRSCHRLVYLTPPTVIATLVTARVGFWNVMHCWTNNDHAIWMAQLGGSVRCSVE